MANVKPTVSAKRAPFIMLPKYAMPVALSFLVYQEDCIFTAESRDFRSYGAKGPNHLLTTLNGFSRLISAFAVSVAFVISIGA